MQAKGLDEIVEDLARDISAGIELVCRCEFPSDYIADRQLKCNNQSLVFQGRIVSTNTSESTDLLADLTKWISTEPTVTAKGEELHVMKNSNEPTEKAEPKNKEHELPNSFPMWTAAPVGGVVFIVVILAVATGIVVACRRQK